MRWVFGFVVLAGCWVTKTEVREKVEALDEVPAESADTGDPEADPG